MPENISDGDIVFLKSEKAGSFYTNIHPKIHSRYILISHNSDASAPSICRELLEDNKVIAWFAQNSYEFSHPKLTPIPIGIENRYNRNGNPDVVLKAMEHVENASERDIFLYMNFSIRTFPEERSQVISLFKNMAYHVTKPKPYIEYLEDLSRSVFVLSPRGNGYDCHRTWEALYMGAIPIVKSSSMDSLFEGLPVVIVNSWDEITEDFLRKKHQEILSGLYNLDKIYMNYWMNTLKDLSDQYNQSSSSKYSALPNIKQGNF
jgi:hypothetical protein